MGQGHQGGVVPFDTVIVSEDCLAKRILRMPSQKSRPVRPHAVAPKRQRGRDRVAAILDATCHLILETGFDALTMTDVAARSQTAVGSLYRFFPTKETLAEALLDRYGSLLKQALTDLVEKAPTQPVEETACALVDLVTPLRDQRAVVLALIDSRSVGSDRRQTLRQSLTDGLTTLLAQSPQSKEGTQDVLATQARLLLHLLKAIWGLQNGGDSARNAVLHEKACHTIQLYLTTTPPASASAPSI